MISWEKVLFYSRETEKESEFSLWQVLQLFGDLRDVVSRHTPVMK